MKSPSKADLPDLLLPHATWVPSFTGLSGACSEQSALWTQEELPVGWGDTYFQDTVRVPAPHGIDPER